MPVMTKVAPYVELEEFNTTSIDMGAVGTRSLPTEYYDVNKFTFTDAYWDFLGIILEKPEYDDFRYDFPVVIPE
jgi:hypothetical protein